MTNHSAFTRYIEKALFITISVLFCAGVGAAGKFPSLEQLEKSGAEIGTITITRQKIFDESIPEESTKLYRWLNKLHILTKEDVVRSQLLFDSEEPLKADVVRETERLLRNNNYLYAASVEVTGYENGVADLEVITKDIWTLTPEVKLSRSGGENYFSYGIEDDNLLGTGASFTLSREENIDRESRLVIYDNKNLLQRRLDFNLGYADNDDGNAFSFGLSRPFFSLDSRWSAGVEALNFDGEDSFYRNGEDIADYRRELTSFNLSRGWSRGKQADWTRRVIAGLAGERSEFSPSAVSTRTIAVPADRELYYPYVGIQLLEDRYTKTTNFKTIDRVEDVFLGTQIYALVGYTSESLGSDRDAIIVSGQVTHNSGSPDRSLLTMAFNTNTRIESGSFENFTSHLGLTWIHKQSSRWQFFSRLELSHIENADLDRQVVLGGSSGLRGYPTRYRNGTGRALLTIEQRYFTKWYPFRLFRVGGAVFFDAGQVWGRNVLGETNDDFLMDAGVGIRLGNTKGASNKVIHIDLAFPLNEDRSIDNVQLIFEVKESF